MRFHAYKFVYSSYFPIILSIFRSVLISRSFTIFHFCHKNLMPFSRFLANKIIPLCHLYFLLFLHLCSIPSTLFCSQYCCLGCYFISLSLLFSNYWLSLSCNVINVCCSLVCLICLFFFLLDLLSLFVVRITRMFLHYLFYFLYL